MERTGNEQSTDRLNEQEKQQKYTRPEGRRERRIFVILLLTLALASLLFLLPPSAFVAASRAVVTNHRLMILLILFTILALSLLWSAGQALDSIVFLYFNRHRLRSPALDTFMHGATQLGDGGFGFLMGAAAYFLGERRLAVEIIFGGLSLWLTVEIIKALADRNRPFITLEEALVVGRRIGGRSFPSGHTSQAFYLMSLLALHFQTGIVLTTILIAIAALVGFTRVYMGVHYPRDVLAGAILGVVWVIIVGLVDPFLTQIFP